MKAIDVIERLWPKEKVRLRIVAHGQYCITRVRNAQEWLNDSNAETEKLLNKEVSSMFLSGKKTQKAYDFYRRISETKRKDG